MRKSKLIALASVATAFSVILLVCGAYFPLFDISAIFLSSLVVMLPLAKKSALSGFLCVIATSILTLLLSGFRFQIVLPYALFFGLHPILNYIFETKNFNKYLALAIKDVWFVVTLLLMYKFTEIIAIDYGSLQQYIIPILIFGGAIIFVAYDYFMKRFQKEITKVIDKIIK